MKVNMFKKNLRINQIKEIEVMLNIGYYSTLFEIFLWRLGKVGNTCKSKYKMIFDFFGLWKNSSLPYHYLHFQNNPLSCFWLLSL